MSNYLHQIAAKSLNLIPVVRPRLTSMFEPPTDRLPVFDPLPGKELEANEVMMSAAVPATLETISQKTDSPLMKDGFTSLRSPEESPTTLSKSVVPSPASSSQDGTNRRSPELSGISTSLAKEDLPLGEVSIPALSSEASSPGNSLIAPVRNSAPEEPSMQKIKPNNVDASVSSSSMTPVRNSAPEEPSMQKIKPNNVDASASNSLMTPLPIKPSSIAPVQPQIIRSISPSLSSSSASASFSPVPSSYRQSSSDSSTAFSSPTIQVTIGRIEVRAIAKKQSSPKASQPRNTKPSLEEYLRSRSSTRASRNGGSS